MEKNDCLTLYDEIVQKKASIWTLFLLNLPLALAIINSSLSYDSKELFSYFSVTNWFHKTIAFLCLMLPLIILFVSWYKFSQLEHNLSLNKKRLDNKICDAIDVIHFQLNELNKHANISFKLNIVAIFIYVIQFYILFIFKK